MYLNGTSYQEFDMDIEVLIYDIAVLHRNYDDILYYFSSAPFGWLFPCTVALLCMASAYAILISTAHEPCLCVVKDVVDMVTGAHNSTRHRINDHALLTHTARKQSDGSHELQWAEQTLALVEGNSWYDTFCIKIWCVHYNRFICTKWGGIPQHIKPIVYFMIKDSNLADVLIDISGTKLHVVPSQIRNTIAVAAIVSKMAASGYLKHPIPFHRHAIRDII